MPADLYRKVIDVNLGGAFFTSQAAARQMVRQGRGGAIVAISSISALVGGAMQSHYTPTKSGRAFPDAVGRDRPRPAPDPLQLGNAGRDRNRHQPQ
jgi:short-subunit dehydrogenase